MDNTILSKFIIGALSAAFLGGLVLLIRHTIRGIRRTSPTRNVIICAAVNGVIGLFLLVEGIINASTLIMSIIIGLVMTGAAAALIIRNFVIKGNPDTDSTDNGENEPAETERPETPDNKNTEN